MYPDRTYLEIHRTLLRAVFAMTHVFAWIFLFEFLFVTSDDWIYALTHTLSAYALVHLVVILVTPYSANRLRDGMRRAMVYAGVCAGAAFLILGSVFAGQWGVPGLGIALFAIVFGLYRALYWVPFMVEHRYAGETEYYLERELLLALLPALSGILLLQRLLTPTHLLYLGAFGALTTLIPLTWMQDRYERFSWDYAHTFARLFSRTQRPVVLDALLLGVENTVLLLIWPLMLLLIVRGNHALFGVSLSITMLVVLLCKVPSASHYITHSHHVDGGHYIDEYTALREMSESFGRVLVCGVVMLAALSGTFIGGLYAGIICGLCAMVLRMVR